MSLLATRRRILANARLFGHALFDVVYPPACTLCGGEFSRSTDIELCSECIDALLDLPRKWCERCGFAINATAIQSDCCSRCNHKSFPYDQVMLLGPYQGAMREAVIASKQAVHEPLAIALGRLLANNVASQIHQTPDWVTFVPSPWRRRWSRGTTPAQTLACQVARALKRPLRPTLKCVRTPAKQGTLNLSQRSANVRGAFDVIRSRAPDRLKVLIVDDVMTTGATLTEVARTLRRAGAQWVGVAAVARGMSAC